MVYTNMLLVYLSLVSLALLMNIMHLKTEVSLVLY